MKNLIYIDVDTEREQPILIGKGPEIPTPTNNGTPPITRTTNVMTIKLRSLIIF